jgi:aldehyde reductase
VPLDETVQAFEALQRDGKIRHWGVSNFDPTLMQACGSCPAAAAQTDQVLYNLATAASNGTCCRGCASTACR